MVYFLYSLSQRILIYELFITTKSLAKTRKLYQKEYGLDETKGPTPNTIRTIVRRVRATGSFENGRQCLVRKMQTAMRRAHQGYVLPKNYGRSVASSKLMTSSIPNLLR